MKYAHLVKVNVFCYEKNNEDSNLILDKFLQLLPFNLKEGKIELKKTNVEGFKDKKITIYEVILTKEKHINKFLTNLSKNIDEEQKKLILEQAESRLDANLDFFIRFDKDEYLRNNKLKLTDSGNCFHIKISIATFPKRRENALEIIKSIFGDNL